MIINIFLSGLATLSHDPVKGRHPALVALAENLERFQSLIQRQDGALLPYFQLISRVQL